MGYSTRILIGGVPDENHPSSAIYKEDKNGWYCAVEVDLWLGSLATGDYHDLLKSTVQEYQSYYFLSGDEDEVVVTHDLYGDPILRLDPPKVLEALKIKAENSIDYTVLQVAISALEQYLKTGPMFSSIRNLAVFHYGY